MRLLTDAEINVLRTPGRYDFHGTGRKITVEAFGRQRGYRYPSGTPRGWWFPLLILSLLGAIFLLSGCATYPPSDPHTVSARELWRAVGGDPNVKVRAGWSLAPSPAATCAGGVATYWHPVFAPEAMFRPLCGFEFGKLSEGQLYGPLQPLLYPLSLLHYEPLSEIWALYGAWVGLTTPGPSQRPWRAEDGPADSVWSNGSIGFRR